MTNEPPTKNVLIVIAAIGTLTAMARANWFHDKYEHIKHHVNGALNDGKDAVNKAKDAANNAKGALNDVIP